MTTPDPFDEHQAHETTIIRLRRHTSQSRTTRETVGNTAGIGGASLVLWLAQLVGIEMPSPEAAAFMGGIVSTVFSSLFRKYLHRSPYVPPPQEP